MKKLLMILLSTFLTACASTSYDNEKFNTINNYEIVFVNGKITKTSELALKQIRNNKNLNNLEITMFRTSEDDLKSLMIINKRKSIVQKELKNKRVKYIYNPKKESQYFYLKVIN